MEDYYRAANAIYRLSKLVENRLALSLDRDESGRISFREVLRAQRFQRTKRIDGFILRGRELAAEKPDVFSTNPARLTPSSAIASSWIAPRIFNSPSICASLPLITAEIVNSPDANASFRAILSQPGAVFPTLNLMHELGVLGRFIPEFDKLTCMVQHEISPPLHSGRARA